MESVHNFTKVHLKSMVRPLVALFLATCFASGSLFTPASALAQKLSPESQAQRLVHESELIFVGLLVHRESEWTANKRLIQTRYVFSVEDNLKGTPADLQTLTEYGGQVGDLAMRVSHTPGYAVGQRYLVFVRQEGNGRMRTAAGRLGQLPVIEGGHGASLLRISPHHPLSSLAEHASPGTLISLDRTVASVRKELERQEQVPAFR